MPIESLERQVERLTNEILANRERLVSLESHYKSNVATQMWVKDAVEIAMRPLQTSMLQLQMDVSKMVQVTEHQSREFLTLTQMHQEVVKQRAEDEQRQRTEEDARQEEKHQAEILAIKQRTLGWILEHRLTPMLQLVLTVSAAAGVVGTFLIWAIKELLK